MLGFVRRLPHFFLAFNFSLPHSVNFAYIMHFLLLLGFSMTSLTVCTLFVVSSHLRTVIHSTFSMELLWLISHLFCLNHCICIYSAYYIILIPARRIGASVDVYNLASRHCTIPDLLPYLATLSAFGYLYPVPPKQGGFDK